MHRRTFAAGLLAASTAGCMGSLPGLGGDSGQAGDDPVAVVEVYLNNHPLATSMSPEEYAERARDWWHSRTQFFDGLEEAMSDPYGGEGDSENGARSVNVLELNTAERNLTTEQLLGLNPLVGVSGSIGDFADEKTALVDTSWEFASASGQVEPNRNRYLTAVENGDWQIVTNVET